MHAVRKLIVSMNVTLDGFMAGPNAELDWHFRSWTEDMNVSICQELAQADTIILGRVTYLAMANYWPSKAGYLSCAREDIAFAEMMNRYKKIVFSKTIRSTTWNNSEIVKGDITGIISTLKNCAGKHMIIYGSGKLVNSLMRANLIDEYVLWVHPVLLGKGKPFFLIVNDELKMELIERKTFTSGVVALRYAVNIPTTKRKLSPNKKQAFVNLKSLE